MNSADRTGFLINATVGYVCVGGGLVSYGLERALVQMDVMPETTEFPFLLLATSVLSFFPASLAYSRIAAEKAVRPVDESRPRSLAWVVWLTAVAGSAIALVVFAFHVTMEAAFYVAD